MDSIGYYDKNPKDFYNRTVHLDVQESCQRFLAYLPSQAKILDAGCGSGRDSRFFLDQGYDVVSFDGSLEMARLASSLLGKTVTHMLFQDISFSGEFDAIWANASLLHVPYEDLQATLRSFHKALLPAGILYASFKYGTSMRQKEDRVFFDMNEARIMPYLKGLFHPLEIWKEADTRSQVAPGPDRSWLHCIAKRLETADPFTTTNS